MRHVNIGQEPAAAPPPPAIGLEVNAGRGFGHAAEVCFTVRTGGRHLVSFTMPAAAARDLAAGLVHEAHMADVLAGVTA